MTSNASLALQLFQKIEQAMKSDGAELTPTSAWNFLYRYNLDFKAGRPHIAESNVLTTKAWSERAARVTSWLADNLAPGKTLSDAEIGVRLGLGNSPGAGGTNATGAGLEQALAFLIDRFTGHRPLVRQSLTTFKGYEIVRKGEVDELDLALMSKDDLRLIISCFWTSRRDRISSDLYESVFVRRRRPDIQVAFVVNEFQPSILNALLTSPDVDAVYHVCRDAVLRAHAPGSPNDSITVGELAADSARARAVTQFMNLKARLKDVSQLFDDVKVIARDVVAATPNSGDPPGA